MSISKTDTDLINKNKELLDIAKLCVVEGELGERGQTFIIAQQGNGLSRLLWASFDADREKWISTRCSINSRTGVWLTKLY